METTPQQAVRAQIEARGGRHRYVVKIIIGEHTETFEIPADDEWKARTRAMALTTTPVHGEYVDFEVTEKA